MNVAKYTLNVSCLHTQSLAVSTDVPLSCLYILAQHRQHTLRAAYLVAAYLVAACLVATYLVAALFAAHFHQIKIISLQYRLMDSYIHGRL